MSDHLGTNTLDAKTIKRELEEYAYRVSHDLSAPIRAMVEFSKLLAQEHSEKLDCDAKEYLSLIVTNGQKVQAMMEGLLEYSQIVTQQNPYSLIDLDDLMIRIKKLLEEAIQSSGAVLTVSTLPKIYGDMKQISQVFYALIDNAIKFQRPENKPHITISAEKKNHFWQFSITDNGIGMKPQFQEKVFKLFARLHLDDQYPGTGLGLALAQKIVHQHGGTIWFESLFTKGSTFYFTLPSDYKT